MKRKIFTLIVALCYIISGCTTYKPFMSDASKNPIGQKLPKMDFEWFAGGDIRGANVDFVKNIVRNEINQNIISDAGQKRGTIEVACKKVHLKQNLGLAFLSISFSLYTLFIPYLLLLVNYLFLCSLSIVLFHFRLLCHQHNIASFHNKRRWGRQFTLPAPNVDYRPKSLRTILLTKDSFFCTVILLSTVTLFLFSVVALSLHCGLFTVTSHLFVVTSASLANNLSTL